MDVDSLETQKVLFGNSAMPHKTKF